MGLAAQDSPQILPETGPRPLVVRGAQLESSSYEGPLGRRENRVEFNERGPGRSKAGLRRGGGNQQAKRGSKKNVEAGPVSSRAEEAETGENKGT